MAQCAVLGMQLEHYKCRQETTQPVSISLAPPALTVCVYVPPGREAGDQGRQPPEVLWGANKADPGEQGHGAAGRATGRETLADLGPQETTLLLP